MISIYYHAIFMELLTIESYHSYYCSYYYYFSSILLYTHLFVFLLYITDIIKNIFLNYFILNTHSKSNNISIMIVSVSKII